MKKLSLCKTLFAVAVMLASRPVYADLTMKMVAMTSCSVTSGKRLSAHASSIAKDYRTDSASFQGTVLSSGLKMKVTIGDSDEIFDGSKNSSVILEPDEKTWFVQEQPSATILNQINRDLASNVIDMHETTTMLGYVVHLYKFYQDGTGIASVGYIWATPDIPSTVSPFGVDPMQDFTQQKKIVGTPLKVSVVQYLRRYNRRFLTVYEATAISTAPIPASAFAIPSDYTEISPDGLAALPQHKSKRVSVHWAYE
jgi:hypothetical protein